MQFYQRGNKSKCKLNAIQIVAYSKVNYVLAKRIKFKFKFKFNLFKCCLSKMIVVRYQDKLEVL